MATLSPYAEAVYRLVPRMPRCLELGFHEHPHLDEIAMFALASDHGQEHFPRIEDSRFVFNRVPGGLFQGKTWQQHWSEGRPLFGTGGNGNPLDEHGRKTGLSGMGLMVNFLGMQDDPVLKPLWNYVQGNDLAGQRQGRYDLAGTVRVDYHYSGLSVEEVMCKAAVDFRAWYRQQQAFLACGRELLEKSRSGLAFAEEFETAGKRWRLAGVDQTTNREIVAYLRHMGSQIVMIRSPRGNVQVFWPQDAEMSDAVAMIRIKEAELRGITLTGDPRAEVVPGLETWHYPGWSLLNGSDSYPDAPPTRIPFPDIINYIRIWVKPKPQA